MIYPKKKVVKPLALAGTSNGKLPDSILESIPGRDGAPTIRLLKGTSARSWKAMFAHALRDGILLSATSLADSYRSYEIQLRIFKERYSVTPIAGQPTKVWDGKTYWLKHGMATAAVPGNSNHGDAIALDNKNTTKPAIDWLLAHAEEYGWSWELDSEPWHLHYFAGDNIPTAVLLFEGGSNHSDDEKEWPYMDDVAFIRHMLVTYLGRRAQTQKEIDMHVYFKATNGDAAWLTMLADSDESVAYRTKVNAHFGFPDRS